MPQSATLSFHSVAHTRYYYSFIRAHKTLKFGCKVDHTQKILRGTRTFADRRGNVVTSVYHGVEPRLQYSTINNMMYAVRTLIFPPRVKIVRPLALQLSENS